MKDKIKSVNRIVKFEVDIELSEWDNEHEFDACEQIAALGLRLNITTANGCIRTIKIEKIK